MLYKKHIILYEDTLFIGPRGPARKESERTMQTEIHHGAHNYCFARRFASVGRLRNDEIDLWHVV